MSIIDQRGRLFGKINVLDLIILLVVVALLTRFGYNRLIGSRASVTGTMKTVEITFLFGEVRGPTVDELYPGVHLYDSKSNALLGKVLAVETVPSTILGPSSEYQSRTRFDHLVTVSAPGWVTGNAVTVSGVEMKVGRSVNLNTDAWAGVGVTWRVNKAPGYRWDGRCAPRKSLSPQGVLWVPC